MKSTGNLSPARGSSTLVIGLVGDCGQTTAEGFFSELQAKQYPHAKVTGIYEPCTNTCPKCLLDFARNNGLSIMFIDQSVEIAGVDCCETNDVLGAIAHDSRCEVYVVGKAG